MLTNEIEKNLEKADTSQLKKWRDEIANLLATALIEQNEDVQSKYAPIYKLLKNKIWRA